MLEKQQIHKPTPVTCYIKKYCFFYRSLCTVVCKWTYCADQALGSGWDRSYFEEIGLGDLSQNDWSAIGQYLRSVIRSRCLPSYDHGGRYTFKSTPFLFRKTGNEIFEPGRPCGGGLTEKAALEMGLTIGIPVATSLIDAHAGGLGMIGIGSKNLTEFKHRLGEYYIRIYLLLRDFQFYDF